MVDQNSEKTNDEKEIENEIESNEKSRSMAQEVAERAFLAAMGQDVFQISASAITDSYS